MYQWGPTKTPAFDQSPKCRFAGAKGRTRMKIWQSTDLELLYIPSCACAWIARLIFFSNRYFQNIVIGFSSKVSVVLWFQTKPLVSFLNETNRNRFTLGPSALGPCGCEKNIMLQNPNENGPRHLEIIFSVKYWPHKKVMLPGGGSRPPGLLPGSAFGDTGSGQKYPRIAPIWMIFGQNWS